jgi:hypothetical protein
MTPSGDALIEASASDALIEAITRSVSADYGHTPRMHEDGANLLLPVRDVIRTVVERLRAGGLSDTTIGATLVCDSVATMRPSPLGERWKLQRRDHKGEWRTIYPGTKQAIWDTPAQACAWAHNVYAPREGINVHTIPYEGEEPNAL